MNDTSAKATGNGRAADSSRAAGDPGADAVAHLRQAALEVIAAAHAVLDVAEDAVRSPGELALRLAGAVVSLRSMIATADPAARRATADPAARAGDGDGPGSRPGAATARSGPRVQHIRIS